MSDTTATPWMFDALEPGLTAGSYTLTAHHELKEDANAAAALTPRQEAKLTFSVSAPRLAFSPGDDVYGCSPPDGAAASYTHALPHVLLRRPSLPWEQTLDGDRYRPWIALVLLDSEDLSEGGVRTMTGAELKAAGGVGVLSPWSADRLGAEMTPAEAEQSVTVLEMKAERFRRVCPTFKELPLLAHVRRVDLSGKSDGVFAAATSASGGASTPGAPETGDFAALLANRTAREGDNTALVISLEGWRAWLESAASADTGKVRVVVLHAWRFRSQDRGVGTFDAMVKELTVGPLRQPDLPASASLAGAFRAGHTPIAHRADGAPTPALSWYRGPLVPARPAAYDASGEAFAEVAEEHTGAPDISYAAAWQLGRMLALASASFGPAVRRWNHTKALDALGSRETVRGTLAEQMASYLTIAGGEGGAGKGSAAFEDVRVVTEWLAALQLLHPVPLHYLVPSERLLPPESLRWFYIDGRWLDALTDGALSLGQQSLTPPTDAAEARRTVRRAVRRMMVQHRSVRRGAALKRVEALVDPPEDQPLCGLLLRSRRMRDFPGIEVVLQDGATRLLPIRMDHVAPDVLLVLAERPPTTVWLKEPREGLRFELSTQQKRDGAADGVVDVNNLADGRGSARLAADLTHAPTDLSFPWGYGQ